MLLTVTSQTLGAEGASPDYMSGSHRDSSVDASCQDWDVSCIIMWPKTYNHPGEPVCSSTTVLNGVVPSSLLGPHRGVPIYSTVFGVSKETMCKVHRIQYRKVGTKGASPDSCPDCIAIALVVPHSRSWLRWIKCHVMCVPLQY